MNGILADIIAHTRLRVGEAKLHLPLCELEAMARDSGQSRGFGAALRAKSASGCALVAEIKTASPSKGIIRTDVAPSDVARIYEANGAACCSVLTEERFFLGSLDRLQEVRTAVNLPLLRKDFIIDRYQVFETKRAGADAMLLIAACLDDRTLDECLAAAGSLGLDCLVEVHDEEEMRRAVATGADIIGINNRDLATFATDLSVTERLAPLAPGRALIVSESGISRAEDVRRVHSAGAGAVLVGEAIMRESDMGAKVRELAFAVVAGS
jgi:indole-3-glycerol phosphate synthase